MSKLVLDIINNRKIILGPSDKIKSSSLSKYSWAYECFQTMQNNDWKASGISLVKDTPHNCNEGTQLAMRRALAFLTNLDGIQVDNLANNIVDHITDYTVKQNIYRQLYEEVNHVDCYDTMIQCYYDDPAQIYLLHEKNDVLREKNDYILAQANALGAQFNVEKFIYAVVSNIILEGVYFHSGFLTFYAIQRMQRIIGGGCEMIQYINRDETVHLYLFLNIFNTLKEEFPEAFTAKVYSNIEKLMDASVDLEINWGMHIIEKGVPGLGANGLENHIKYLGDEKLRLLSMPKLYNVTDPYPWVKDFMINPNLNNKNFFESKTQAYTKRKLDRDSDI